MCVCVCGFIKVMHTRSDHVSTVYYPDNTVVVEHADGTRIMTVKERKYYQTGTNVDSATTETKEDLSEENEEKESVDGQKQASELPQDSEENLSNADIKAGQHWF